MKLLEKRKVQELRATGVLDRNDQMLFDGDVVKITTTWTKDIIGDIKLRNGIWVVRERCLILPAEYRLEGEVCVEKISTKAGDINIVESTVQ